MQLQLLLLAALSTLASSAPRPWRFQPWDPATREFLGAGGIDGRRRMIEKEMPHIQSCNNFDVSTAQMPPLPSALPPPSAGLKPFHVGLGRGTQVSQPLPSIFVRPIARLLTTNRRIIPVKPTTSIPPPSPYQSAPSPPSSISPATPP